VSVNREHLAAPDSLANLFCHQVPVVLIQVSGSCTNFKGFAYPTAPQTFVDSNLPDCQCAHIDYSATRSHQQSHLILVRVKN
jgi:hypothetical protein